MAAAAFTPSQRDLQARGKHPYPRRSTPHGNHTAVGAGPGVRRRRSSSSSSSNAETSWNDGSQLRPLSAPQEDDFEREERQGFALSVLSDYDRLMVQAVASGDSIPGKRHELEAMLCGMDKPPPQKMVDTETSQARALMMRRYKKKKDREREAKAAAAAAASSMSVPPTTTSPTGQRRWEDAASVGAGGSAGAAGTSLAGDDGDTMDEE